MADPLPSRLLSATRSTLEELGFVFPVTELADHQAAAPLAWRARVTFDGPVRGELMIEVTEGVAEQLAANMLGVIHRVDESMRRDALGEIANVICGNVVHALGCPEDVFDLGAPQVGAAGSDRISGLEMGAAIHLPLGIEDGRAEIWLILDRSVAAIEGPSVPETGEGVR